MRNEEPPNDRQPLKRFLKNELFCKSAFRLLQFKLTLLEAVNTEDFFNLLV